MTSENHSPSAITEFAAEPKNLAVDSASGGSVSRDLVLYLELWFW
jgi:hypothetical protein